METSNSTGQLLDHVGGTRGELHGNDCVLDFGDWIVESQSLHETGGIIPLGSSTRLELTGGERLAFLNRLSTNQVGSLAAGEGRETFLVDISGRILAHLFVFAGKDSIVLRAVPGMGPKIASHLDYYLINDDVQIHDRSADQCELLLIGLSVEATVAGVLGATPPAGDLAEIETEWDGAEVSLRRIEAKGLDVLLLSADCRVAIDLWDAFRSKGIPSCGKRAFETVRIEQGWPHYGVDITERSLPQEIGRDAKTISFTKGCYLGQEIVARIDSRGNVNKVLVGLHFESAEIPPPGGDLTADGQPAGQVTSSAFSPTLEKVIALGYVRRAHREPGTRVDSAAGKVTVVPLPMV